MSETSDLKIIFWFAFIAFSAVGLSWIWGEYIRTPPTIHEMTLDIQQIVFIEHPKYHVNSKYVLILGNGTQLRVWMREPDAYYFRVGHNNTVKYYKDDLGVWIFEVNP